MRVFICTDLEGGAGVETLESVYKDNPGFKEAYANLAEDINAAVRGAFFGGADEVAVVDGHGPGGLDFNLVDPRVIVQDRSFVNSYVDPFDALFCVGYHAMAGTQNAFLDHTQSGVAWFEYKINGRPSGELAQEAMWASHHNAPLILMTGCEAAVAEAHNFFGDIECIAVKRAIGRHKCVTYDKTKTREKIQKAACSAVKAFIDDPSQYKVYKPALPAEMLLTYSRTDYADNAMDNKTDLERVGPRTVRKIITEYGVFNNLKP